MAPTLSKEEINQFRDSLEHLKKHFELECFKALYIFTMQNKSILDQELIQLLTSDFKTKIKMLSDGSPKALANTEVSLAHGRTRIGHLRSTNNVYVLQFLFNTKRSTTGNIPVCTGIQMLVHEDIYVEHDYESCAINELPKRKINELQRYKDPHHKLVLDYIPEVSAEVGTVPPPAHDTPA